MAKKKRGEPTVTAGTLKLPPKDAQRFQAAIEDYGFERPATFLRLCAHMIIRHYEAGEQVALPMRLRLAKPLDDPDNDKPQENFQAKKQK